MAKIKVFGHCKLCNTHAELMGSHIFPNFLIERHVRESPTGKMRLAGNPNLAIEDGPKEKLLCSICEQRFNRNGEKFYAENVDAIYAKGLLKSFTVSEPICYYAASVIWRQLVWNQPDGLHQTDIVHLGKMESSLRDYLMGRSTFPGMPFIRWHMLMPDVIQEAEAPSRINEFLRSTIGPIDGFMGSICYRSFIGQGILIVTISSIDDTALPEWQQHTELNLGSVICPGYFTKDYMFHDVVEQYLKIPPVSARQNEIIGKRLRNAAPSKIINSPYFQARQVDRLNQELRRNTS